MRIGEPARSALLDALAAAGDARRRGELDAAWSQLERAHVLSQPWAGPHLRVHAEMLRTAWCARDGREAFGQVLRLLVAGPGSLTGRYPDGNTGRARVSMFAPMPAPEDLRRILGDSR